MPLIKYWLGSADRAKAKQHKFVGSTVDSDGFLQVKQYDALCSSCGATPDDLKRFNVCGACQSVQYCSKECQHKHWNQMDSSDKNHSTHCSLLARLTALMDRDANDDKLQDFDAALKEEFSTAELKQLGIDAETVRSDQLAEAPSNDDSAQKRIQAWIWDPFTRQWYWRVPGTPRGQIYWTLWGWRPWWWR